jgi:hypothetical protein
MLVFDFFFYLFLKVFMIYSLLGKGYCDKQDETPGR